MREGYIDTTIATVRQHRSSDNAWPQWTNALADQIEELRAELASAQEELAFLRDQYARRPMTRAEPSQQDAAV